MLKRIILGIISGAIIVCSFFFVYKYVIAKPAVDPVLTSILEDPSIKNNTKDWVGNIGVSSVKDVAYYIQKDLVHIRYGKQDFAVSIDKLDNDDIKTALNKLHLKVYKNKNGKVIALYGGEQVKEWVETQ